MNVLVKAQIRPYSPNDREAVAAILRSNIPKYFVAEEEAMLREFLDGFAGAYFVCTIGGDVVGSGGVALNEGPETTVSLCWGMVRADHLGTGLGKDLTQFRIDRSRSLFGDLPIVISTSQHTQGFYEKLGFRLTRHEPDGFGPGIDNCKMRLETSHE